MVQWKIRKPNAKDAGLSWWLLTVLFENCSLCTHFPLPRCSWRKMQVLDIAPTFDYCISANSFFAQDVQYLHLEIHLCRYTNSKDIAGQSANGYVCYRSANCHEWMKTPCLVCSLQRNKTQCQICKRLAWPIIPHSWSGLVWKRVSSMDVITMGRSITIFLCIRHGDNRPNNRPTGRS